MLHTRTFVIRALAALAIAHGAAAQTAPTVVISPTPKLQFFDATGARPLPGGCVATYQAGTTTPLQTFTDATGMVPNPNPVMLDASGRAGIWIAVPSIKYVVKSPVGGMCSLTAGTVLYTTDNIQDSGLRLRSDLAGVNGGGLIGMQQPGGIPITIAGAIGSMGIYDIGYNTLSSACLAAATAPLLISKKWTAVPTQTLNCNVNFLPGGSVQPGATQTVTFAKFPVCPGNQPCFDTSVGGTTSIKFSGSVSTPVYAAWFGAVCNGVLDPAAGNFHDDYPALMSAHSSLPLNQPAGGMTPSGTPLPAGTVIIPNTATLASGANGGCVIGPADPGLYWSPFVRLQSASSMFNAIIEAAQGFAPQVGSSYTITGINACGGGVTCTVQIGAGTAGLANGDTVELHGIAGFGVAGPWQLNSWANNHNQGYNLNGGMWQIANVTGTSFDLAGSGAFGSQPAWVAGGTAVKGTEKFLLTLINIHDGSSPYPVDNYNVNIGDISFYAQAANNQFASGLFCNCSVSTWIHHDLISVPYRAFVAAIGIDNVTVDDLLITGPTTRTNGPDGQAVSIITNDSLETFATHFRNLKVNGATYNNWTPALSVGGNATTFHLDVGDFENVTWPIAVNIAGQTGQNISLEHITAKTDNFTGPCRTMYNTVVAIFNSSVNNQVGTGINVSGDFQCFANSITQGSAPANLTQVPGMPVPQGPNDFKWLPLTFDDNNFVTHSFLAAPWLNTLTYAPRFVVTCAIAVCTTQTGSTVMYQALAGVTTGSRPDISPSSWAVTTGAPNIGNYTGFNTYVNGTYAPSVWSAPNSLNWLVPGNDQGFRCFKDQFGGGAPSSISAERLMMTTSDCTAAGTASDQYRFIEMRPPTVPFPNNGIVTGYGLALDGDGKLGTGMGGNFLLNGTERNIGVAFAQLPAIAPGLRVWVTDGAVGSNPCTGGGNGTWAETISTGPGAFKWICR